MRVRNKVVVGKEVENKVVLRAEGERRRGRRKREDIHMATMTPRKGLMSALEAVRFLLCLLALTLTLLPPLSSPLPIPKMAVCYNLELVEEMHREM
jgi:hypothetical protein